MNNFTATIEGIDNGFIVSAGLKTDTVPIMRRYVKHPLELGEALHDAALRCGFYDECKLVPWMEAKHAPAA